LDKAESEAAYEWRKERTQLQKYKKKLGDEVESLRAQLDRVDRGHWRARNALRRRLEAYEDLN